MKYKFIALISLFILFTSCSTKDNLTDRFKADIAEYSEAYNKCDWEKVTGMIYPKLFAVTSREEIINTMKSLDSMGMKTTLKLNRVDKISEIVKHGDEKFCLINYSTTLKIVIEKELLAKIDEFKKEFDEQFGKENILFDEKQNTFTIQARQMMFAISNKERDDWKYVEHDKDQKDNITLSLIPEEVLQKLVR